MFDKDTCEAIEMKEVGREDNKTMQQNGEASPRPPQWASQQHTVTSLKNKILSHSASLGPLCKSLKIFRNVMSMIVKARQGSVLLFEPVGITEEHLLDLDVF